MPNVFEIQSMPSCPRCDARVIRVIMEIGKPTKYVHARNNQEDFIHEDLTSDLKEEKVTVNKGCAFHLSMPIRVCPSCRAASGLNN